MDYLEARALAEKVCHQLAPYCDRLKICGSIRRRKPEVSDIDLVVLPKTVPVKDMFGMITHNDRHPGFVDVVNQWEKVKGDATTGKYTQRLIEGHRLEIAISSPLNWGNLMLIRTGNSDFSQLIMTIALKRGFQQKDGYLWKGDKLIPLLKEEDYFRVLDIPYVAPEMRTKDAYRKLKS